MFRNAKVGDRVWSILRGWAEITYINPKGEYPIVVSYNDYSEYSYTYDGKSEKSDILPVLYWGEVTITSPKKPPPDLPVDTKVLVWDDGGEELPRHFCSFNEEGRITTWAGGYTSFTTCHKNACTEWDHWRLYEEL